MVGLKIFRTQFSRHVFLLVSFAILGGCDEGTPSREAVAAMETFEALLQQATTTDTEYMFAYEERFVEVRRTYGRIHEALMAIPGKRERMNAVTRMNERLQESIVTRLPGFQELGFHIRSCVMFDGLVQVVWETAGDERRVFALWERRRRKCIAAAERCEREEEELKKDYRRLLSNGYRISARMARVSMKELTEEEIVTLKEYKEKEPKIAERLRALYFLPDTYRRSVPGEEGAKLAGGKLYERFQKLSPKELDELVNQCRP